MWNQCLKVAPTQPAVSSRAGASVLIESLGKAFGPVRALDDVTLSIEPGEFVALLGPSGSGKTTLLMILAGFEAPDGGRIVVDGTDVTSVPAHKRNLGMMFQRYALFPHLNVVKNVEYPLRARGLGPAARGPLVEAALRLVSLTGFEHRRIDQLSGGQQQRVALARAIVFSPPLLLMDEPLGALDRKLREEVQLELRQLHRRISSTVVFVTHDQQEAMTMADRVAVMDHARIVQVGTPSELFERPGSQFVAGFLGNMNFLDVRPEAILSTGCTVDAHGLVTTVPPDRVFGQRASQTLPSSGTLAVRPHEVVLSREPSSGVPAVVIEMFYTGPRSTVVVDAGGHRLIADMPSPDAACLRPGDHVSVSWNAASSLLYLD